MGKQDWIESEKKKSDPLEDSEHVPGVPERETEYRIEKKSKQRRSLRAKEWLRPGGAIRRKMREGWRAFAGMGGCAITGGP